MCARLTPARRPRKNRTPRSERGAPALAAVYLDVLECLMSQSIVMSIFTEFFAEIE